jgi:transposase
MKSTATEEFAARIGIDWGDAKHDICLLPEGATAGERCVLTHSPEAIDEWVHALRNRFGARPIAIALELDKGPLVYALQKYDGFVLFPINPTTLARYRKAFTPSGAKDDPTDAELALDLLCRHPEQLTALCPQSAPMRALQQLVEQRRQLIADRVRLTNRITSALKNYFPQPLHWFDDKGTVLFCNFLARWPTLKQVQRARRASLRSFFLEHNVRRDHLITERIDAIRSATALTQDDAVIAPNALLVETLVVQLRCVLDAVEKFDLAIAATVAKITDYPLFAALPGAGPTLAPRLLVAFGEQRDRYHHASQLQKYSGIAPVTERSGKSSWVHWRYAAPTFLRQTFVEWAAQTIPRSFWARAFYDQQRAKGSSHQAALRALAFKWIRIVFRCWQERVPYDETTYLNSLQRRRSSLLSSIATTNVLDGAPQGVS